MPVKKLKRNHRKPEAFWWAEEFANPANADDLPYQGLILSLGLIVVMIIFALMVTRGGHL